MPKKLQVEVKESVSELETLLRKAKSDRQRGRLKALLLIKLGKVEYQSQIASKLGFTEKTVREWLKTYNSHGLSTFITIKVGGNNTRKISDRSIAFIAEKLNDPMTTITSYVELREIIKEELSESIHYGALYSHCRRKHKSKLKVSRKSHYKKNPQQEAVFKKPKISI